MSGVGSVGSGEVYWARLEASALAASAACPVWKERKKERKKERMNVSYGFHKFKMADVRHLENREIMVSQRKSI